MKYIYNYRRLFRKRAAATSLIYGSEKYPEIHGRVQFFKNKRGVLVRAEIHGLPRGSSACDSPVFGLHIHSGTKCSGNKDDPFADAQGHYNPNDCAHPFHAGDMPPLFGADGYAFTVFLTNRFSLEDILWKTVIIHSMPDDFKTQPSGNSGEKIACGVIMPG